MAHPSNSMRRGLRLAAAIGGVLCSTGLHTGWAADWTEISNGLPGAAVRVAGLIVSAKSSSTIYARTYGADGSQGLFKSTDGAASWKPVSSIVGAYNLAVDPQNPAVLYAITNRGILKTTNGGESWTRADKGLTDTYVNTLAIDPLTTSTLYAVAGARSIFKSVDAGSSWDALDASLPENAYVASIFIDPASPSSIYVIGSAPQSNGPPKTLFLKSTDAGGSWSALDGALPPNSMIRSLAFAPAAPSTIYGLGSTGSAQVLLKSTDGALSWTAIDTGLPSGANVLSLVPDPKDSFIIYIAVLFPFAQAGGLLKSTDGGKSWHSIDTGLPANTPVQNLLVDPATPSTLYMISNGAMFKSTDGGAHWNASDKGLTTVSAGALAVSPADADTVYAAAGNNLFKSSDSGSSWSKLFGFQLFLFSPPPFIGLPFPDGAPSYPRSLLIDYTNPDVLYAGTSRGNGCFFADNLLFKSTDGGLNWTDSISPDKSGCVLGGLFGPTAGLKAMDPTDPNTLYLVETDDEDGVYLLLRSKDGGASWNFLRSFPGDAQAGIWALAIDPGNPATLYAGLDDIPIYTDAGIKPGVGGIFKSTDGGESWKSIGLGGSAVNLVAIDPANPNVLYAAAEGNYAAPRGFRGLFKSADGGATWSAMNKGLDGLPDSGANMTALVIDPANSNILYAGTAGGGVFKSSDAGASWSPLNSGLGNLDIRALAMAPGSRHTLYAATSGGIFRIFDETR